MIRSIGNDQTTSDPRPYGTCPVATPFSEVFGSLATTAAAMSPSSFTIRHRSAGTRDPAPDNTEISPTLNDAIAAFKKELSLTPAERMRRDVLKSMNLTEEAIEALPAEERVETEERIAREVARRMEIMTGGLDRPASVAAGTLIPS